MQEYDRKETFQSFINERENPETPFNMEVLPIVKNFIGNIKEKNILDIGCGLGHFIHYLSNQDVNYALGVDISQNEIDYANINFKAKNNEFVCMDANNISHIKTKFDIVVGNISFDYIDDFDKLLKNINKILNKNGLLVFSQVHPLSTAPIIKKEWIKDDKGNYIYQLSNYSEIGERKMKYFNSEVTMYHRTFSYIVNIIIKNGFTIEEINEPIPSKEELEKYPEREKNLHKPSFLIFKLKKI